MKACYDNLRQGDIVVARGTTVGLLHRSHDPAHLRLKAVEYEYLVLYSMLHGFALRRLYPNPLSVPVPIPMSLSWFHSYILRVKKKVVVQ